MEQTFLEGFQSPQIYRQQLMLPKTLESSDVSHRKTVKTFTFVLNPA